MRTVDIDKALSDIIQEIAYWQEKSTDNHSYCKFIIAALEFCLEKLESCPQVNNEIPKNDKSAEELLRTNKGIITNLKTNAHWIYAGYSGYYSPYFECSNCKIRSKNVTAYCPNCGSEMD